jgi:Ca-activated chloride channel family protein
MNTHALGLTLAVDERGLHPATKVRVHLVVEVAAIAPGIERARPPLSVVLAVDTSGSMAGPPIEHVIQSIDRLVALLEPTDRVALVVFANSAAVVTELLPATAETRRLVSTRAHRLVAEGGTNVEDGLTRAAALLPPRGEHERQVILLLSDGAPNVGRASTSDLADLCRSFRPDIGVSTLGYGAQHNEDVLRAISDAGAGGYHFISDPRVCELSFAQAIGAQGDIVAEAIEVSLFLEPGVEISRFVGTPGTRFGAQGLKLSVPDLLDGSRYLVAAELDVTPPREVGPWKLLGASLTYRRAGEREPLTIVETLRTTVRDGARQVDPRVRAMVLRARSDEARGDARALADRGQYEGAAAVLRRQIQAIHAEPWFVANDGSPLAEAVEQLVDEAVAMERKPSQEDYRTFRKSQLGTVLSTEMPGGPDAGPRSRFALRAVAGQLPAARLVVLRGDLAGRTFVLAAPRTVIGRTTAADISLDDANVSRQHLVIAGQNGKFMAVDMGSTNTTLVNGQKLERPVPLSPGDVIRVGDVELRYDEDPK